MLDRVDNDNSAWNIQGMMYRLLFRIFLGIDIENTIVLRQLRKIHWKIYKMNRLFDGLELHLQSGWLISPFKEV